MKIYNDITMILDDSGEWEVISEDSFDHDGDVMLMKDDTWHPSSGEWGWFGAAGGSNQGDINRGLAPDAADTSLMREAKNKLDTLQVEYDRLTGGESIFDTLKRAEADDAAMTADEGMEDIAAQDSMSGFSGGTGGRNSRSKLLKRLRNTVKSITAEKDEEETAAVNRIRGNMQEIMLSVKGAIKDADNEFDVDEYINFTVPGGTTSEFEDTTRG
jgi:hypothetical protein